MSTTVFDRTWSWQSKDCHRTPIFDSDCNASRLGGIAGVLGKTDSLRGKPLGREVSPLEFAAPLSQLSEGGQGGNR